MRKIIFNYNSHLEEFTFFASVSSDDIVHYEILTHNGNGIKLKNGKLDQEKSIEFTNLLEETRIFEIDDNYQNKCVSKDFYTEVYTIVAIANEFFIAKEFNDSTRPKNIEYLFKAMCLCDESTKLFYQNQ